MSGSDSCVCGHSREAHSGHTVAKGSPERTHCSQGCGCRAFQSADRPPLLDMPYEEPLTLTDPDA